MNNPAHSLLLVVILAVAACGGTNQGNSDTSPADSSATEDAGVDSSDASATTASGEGASDPKACHLHTEAIAECQARGDNFAYGRPFPIRCKGTAPTEEEEKLLRQQAEATACSCYDRVAYEHRRHQCSMVP